MHTLYLLLGSNLGDKLAYLADACIMIENRIGKITTKSAVYRTEPWGFSHEEDFYNQVLSISTSLEAEEILSRCLKIEEELGRKRKEGNYEARTIDLDILLLNGITLQTEKLTIPHAKMHLRRFTLIPLNEIAPDLVHPVSGKTISRLLQECEDDNRVEAI